MYKYEDATSILLKEFPELWEFYDEDYEEIRYTFYEIDFGRYVMKMVYENNETELRRIFDFTERLLTDGDEGMVNLAGVAIVEWHYFDQDFMDRYEELSKYFGEHTKKSFEDCINWRPPGQEEIK